MLDNVCPYACWQQPNARNAVDDGDSFALIEPVKGQGADVGAPKPSPIRLHGLFVPCFVDAFFPEVGIATLELLERFRHEVVYPRDQTCCGQPMADNGFNADSAATEALFVRNFSGFDYVVAPEGSCRPSCAR